MAEVPSSLRFVHVDASTFAALSEGAVRRSSRSSPPNVEPHQRKIAVSGPLERTDASHAPADSEHDSRKSFSGPLIGLHSQVLSKRGHQRSMTSVRRVNYVDLETVREVRYEGDNAECDRLSPCHGSEPKNFLCGTTTNEFSTRIPTKFIQTQDCTSVEKKTLRFKRDFSVMDHPRMLSEALVLHSGSIQPCTTCRKRLESSGHHLTDSCGSCQKTPSSSWCKKDLSELMAYKLPPPPLSISVRAATQTHSAARLYKRDHRCTSKAELGPKP